MSDDSRDYTITEGRIERCGISSALPRPSSLAPLRALSQQWRERSQDELGPRGWGDAARVTCAKELDAVLDHLEGKQS